jgi:PleD family two-component response regulator
MGIEQRKQKRIVLRREVIINNAIKAMGLDLSEGGLYVHTGRSFPEGSIVGLSVPIDKEMLHIKARVQYSQEGVGMGLMFVELTHEQKLTIHRFIEGGTDEQPDTKKKILIVDDNATARRMNKSKLVLDGFSVVEAADGIEAIKILETDNISLMILDLYMEKLDGYKVLSIIRQKPEWKDLPVLVFSARSTPDEIDRAMNAGATEFLVKMMTSPIKLSERVKQHLRSK